MSSDLFAFDNSCRDENSQKIQENINILTEEDNDTLDETSYLDQIASFLLSSSPPNSEPQNLSPSHIENAEYSVLEVKTEQSQVNFHCFSSCSNSLDVARETFIQKDYSQDYFQNKQKCSFLPQSDCALQSQNSQNRILSSPGSSFSSDEMKSFCSTRDLQERLIMQTRTKSFTEEANFKVGRCSAEERKEKIDRYRAKRNRRNFSKKIKYACRKTLADNRPRIRGRFARDDHVEEILKARMFHTCEDDLWIDGFREEDDEGIARIGSFFDSLGSTLYQNYSY